MNNMNKDVEEFLQENDPTEYKNINENDLIEYIDVVEFFEKYTTLEINSLQKKKLPVY